MGKGREWLKRYRPAEIIGTLTAIISASVAHLFSKNNILIAYPGSLGEAAGFYGTVLIQRIMIADRKTKRNHKKISLHDFIKIFSGIILEFGPAGLIDGLLLRPLFMYLFPLYLKHFTLGILAGKFMADITFYILVIASYEITKRKHKSLL